MDNDQDFFITSKYLIKKIGLELAALLCVIVNKNAKNQERDTFFEYTIEQLQKDIGFTKYQQAQRLKKLIKLGFLNMQLQGMPAKRYFKLNYKKLPDCLKEQVGQAQLPVLKTNSPPKKISNKQEQSDFEQLWEQYPNKRGKQKALTAYKKAIKAGATFDEIMQGIQNYKFYIEQKGIEQEYIKHGSTWFHQKGWEDDYTVIEREPIKKKSRYETLEERNNRAFAEFLKDEDLSDLPKVYEDCLKGLTEGFKV